MTREEWIAAHPSVTQEESDALPCPPDRVFSKGALEGKCGTLHGKTPCGAEAVYTDPYGYLFCQPCGESLLKRYGGKWVYPIAMAHLFKYA